ncbi:MAG: SpoIIIAH-like family protein [Lachnospiraceae bacterium]|nr:SpoIIIAH-like family protein [Lachnospiraceae bacterium]
MKERNMKKLFRRNQIIITTLAIMIAAAGYLNYAGKKELEASADNTLFEAGSLEISDEDLRLENELAGYGGTQVIEEAQPTAETQSLAEEAQNPADSGTQLAEIESWDEGEEAGLENPGEAVLTSGLTVSDYIAGVQLNREQIRAKNKETLNSIINNTNIDEAAKQEAIQNMIAMTAVAEKENAAETLLQAKGFSDPVVSLTDGKVDVVINAAAITDQQRAQIEDIVKRKTEIPAEGIVITLLKLEE